LSEESVSTVVVPEDRLVSFAFGSEVIAGVRIFYAERGSHGANLSSRMINFDA
jgi:hypothetical protein